MAERKCALVTGSVTGMGRAMILRLARDGFDTVINYHRQERAEGARQLIREVQAMGTGAIAVQADVSQSTDCDRLVQEATDAFGRIDVLVNNAGIRRDGLLLWMPHEDWYGVLRTHLDGFFHVTQPLLKGMLVRKYGRIINIASTRYLMSEPGSEGYAASKGGIRSLTHALALSLAPLHVTVNSIAPGWIEHANYEGLRPEDHAQHPSGRVGRPEDIARLCLFLCAEANDFIDGENITVDGGMTRKMIYVE